MDQNLIQKLNSSEKSESRASIYHRGNFDNDFQYYLAMLGCLAGYGSFWRFSYLFYVNGGSVFLIPYFIFMILLGAPILHLENVLGQLSQTTSVSLFQRLHPKLKGVGVFPMIIAFNLAAYYNTILVYSWVFFFNSFASPLPWTVDRSPTDVLNEKYFHQTVLHRTHSIQEIGSFQPYLFFLYIFSILLCTLAIIKGVKVSGKITLVTASLPYLLLIVLLIRGLFLDAASDALKELMTPKLSNLLYPTIWRDAAIQVFFQLSVGTGIPIMFSSFKNKKTPIGKFTWYFCLGIAVCGMLSVVIVYIYMFHFTSLYGIKFEDVVVEGPSLAFVVFSQALSLLPWANLWSILFYFTLILLGIDSEFGFMETVAATLEDMIKDFHKGDDPYWIRKRIGIVLSCCAVLFTFGNGYYMFLMMDSFTCNLPIAIVCLVEAYLIGRRLNYQLIEDRQIQLTGVPTHNMLLNEITGSRITIMLIVILVIGIIDQIRYSMSLSFLLNVLGWTIVLTPMVVSVFYWQWTQAELVLDELDPRSMFAKSPKSAEIEMY